MYRKIVLGILLSFFLFALAASAPLGVQASEPIVSITLVTAGVSPPFTTLVGLLGEPLPTYVSGPIQVYFATGNVTVVYDSAARAINSSASDITYADFTVSNSSGTQATFNVTERAWASVIGPYAKRETSPITGRTTTVTIEPWVAVGTTGYSDGDYTFAVSVTLATGEIGSASLDVVIDNTKPTVSITNLRTGDKLKGTVNLTLSASDTNLKSVVLVVDKSETDVTGKTSILWDTTTVGDGNHTVLLIAEDKAGNLNEAAYVVSTTNVRDAINQAVKEVIDEATANVTKVIRDAESLAISNIKQARESAFTTSTALGVLMGIVAGVAVAYVVLQRRTPIAPPPPAA